MKIYTAFCVGDGVVQFLKTFSNPDDAWRWMQRKGTINRIIHSTYEDYAEGRHNLPPEEWGHYEWYIDESELDSEVSLTRD